MWLVGTLPFNNTIVQKELTGAVLSLYETADSDVGFLLDISDYSDLKWWCQGMVFQTRGDQCCETGVVGNPESL